MHWNNLKKNPLCKGFESYGRDDIDAINYILEDWYLNNKEQVKKGVIGSYSIFHHIGNYIFSRDYKKKKHSEIWYNHEPIKNGILVNIRDTLKEGDIVNGKTVTGIAETDSNNIIVYNVNNPNEQMNINFDNFYPAVKKQMIIETLDGLKNKIDRKRKYARYKTTI